jgi:beta-glucosidase
VVGPVNEDPHVDLIASASEDIYLNRGRVPFPWRLGMDSAVQSASIDVAAQGDAIRLTWTDQGAIAIDGPAVDLSRRAQEGQALVIEWRIEAHVEGKVEVSLGGGSLDLSPGMRVPSGDRLIEQQIPLRCFESAGANLKSVATPVRLKAQKGLVLTVRNVRLATTTAMNDCPATLR